MNWNEQSYPLNITNSPLRYLVMICWSVFVDDTSVITVVVANVMPTEVDVNDVNDVEAVDAVDDCVYAVVASVLLLQVLSQLLRSMISNRE